MKKIIILIAFIAVTATVSFGQNTSVYTSLDTKDCKTLEQEDEGAGWYRGECRGVGGYKLEVTEGDLRQSINIVSPSGDKSELSFGAVSSGFSSVGAKAEWRLKGKTPVGLIVRFNASEDPADATKITSYLIVIKIKSSGSCITDVVKPSKSQNVLARNFADQAGGKPCKEF